MNHLLGPLIHQHLKDAGYSVTNPEYSEWVEGSKALTHYPQDPYLYIFYAYQPHPHRGEWRNWVKLIIDETTAKLHLYDNSVPLADVDLAEPSSLQQLTNHLSSKGLP